MTTPKFPDLNPLPGRHRFEQRTMKRSTELLRRYWALINSENRNAYINEWDHLIREYTMARLHEARLADPRPREKVSYLYLGYVDWQALRSASRQVMEAVDAAPGKLPPGAVGFLYSCPVFLVDAEYHLMLCEVTE